MDSTRKNKNQKILWNCEINMDHSILARRPDVEMNASAIELHRSSKW